MNPIVSYALRLIGILLFVAIMLIIVEIQKRSRS
jgi:hypothetical protein